MMKRKKWTCELSYYPYTYIITHYMGS